MHSFQPTKMLIEFDENQIEMISGTDGRQTDSTIREPLLFLRVFKIFKKKYERPKRSIEIQSNP